MSVKHVMEPCLNAVHPAKWNPQPVRVCDSGPASASVTDRSPVLPIDHVALSAGRPDGLYVAGKRLRPWLTYEQRWLRDELHDARRVRRLSAEEYATLRQLDEHALYETCVVRWEIENGLPGAATEVRAEKEWGATAAVPVAYTWPPSGHVHVYALTHALLRWALDAMGRGDSTNKYVDSAFPSLDGIDGTDEWVLPLADVCRDIASADLNDAHLVLLAAEATAKKWGAA